MDGCWTDVECVCVCRVNLESIQSESNTLIKQLKNSEKKVLSSSEDMKEQYLSPIQVQQSRLRPLLEDLLIFTGFYFTTKKSGVRMCLPALCGLLLLLWCVFRRACGRVSSCSSCCPWWRTRGRICPSTCVKTAAASPSTNSSAPSRPSEDCSSEPSRSAANHRPAQSAANQRAAWSAANHRTVWSAANHRAV